MVRILFGFFFVFLFGRRCCSLWGDTFIRLMLFGYLGIVRFTAKTKLASLFVDMLIRAFLLLLYILALTRASALCPHLPFIWTCCSGVGNWVIPSCCCCGVEFVAWIQGRGELKRVERLGFKDLIGEFESYRLCQDLVHIFGGI